MPESFKWFQDQGNVNKKEKSLFKIDSVKLSFYFKPTGSYEINLFLMFIPELQSARIV